MRPAPDTDHALTLAAADLGDNAIVFMPPPNTSNYQLSGYIRSMRHRITPASTGAITWAAEFAVDTLTTNIPGAFLP